MTSLIQSDVLENLGDILTAMAAFAGGSIPATGSTGYNQWVKWIQLSQYSVAKRGFWARCLTPATVVITANQDYSPLPDDFFKRNGIYVFNVGTQDWNSASNTDGQKLMVNKHPTTGKWIVKYIGYTPTETTTATMWYFFNPPIPVDQEDIIFFDGEMIMYGALKEYFRQTRQPGSQDDARNEFENRLNDNLSLEMLPTPQELISWKSVYQHTGLSPMDEVVRSVASNRRL